MFWNSEKVHQGIPSEVSLDRVAATLQSLRRRLQPYIAKIQHHKTTPCDPYEILQHSDLLQQLVHLWSTPKIVLELIQARCGSSYV